MATNSLYTLPACLIALSASAQSLPPLPPTEDEQPRRLSRVIVQMKPAIGSAFAAAMASPAAHLGATYSAAEVTSVRKTSIPGLATAEVSAEGLKSLRSDPRVLRVLEDRLSRPALLQTVHLIGADAPTLPKSGIESGAGQVIAIVDTGVNSLHPFLKGKVIDEACFSTHESTIYKLQSLCPNGLDTQIMPGAALDCDRSISGCGHGTHVAGIAVGGPINNGPGATMRGIAPAAKVISVQAYTQFNDPQVCGPVPTPCALSFTSDQLRALDYILRLSSRYPIAAVNMSLGSGTFSEACIDDPLYESISKLSGKRIATVVSSGNDGFVGSIASPACVPGAISVAASTKSDALASEFSNISDLVSLLAPGDQVVSASGAQGFSPMRGTSMAAPHVSGAWAVIRQVWPDADVKDVLQILQSAGVPVLDRRTGKSFLSIRVDAAQTLAKNAGGAQAAVAQAGGSVPLLRGSQDLSQLKPPTRVIVELPNTDAARRMGQDEIAARIKTAVGEDARVDVTNQRAIVEHASGISKTAESRIREELGQQTKIAPDRIARPLRSR